MKCPSCGYENSEDARYCNLCQASFVREPSASYGLPSLAEPKKEGVKAARTVLKSQSTGENWFQRHLNWTWVLAQLAVGLIAYFVVTVFVASLFVTSTTLPSEESLLASVSVLQIMGVVLQLIAMFGVGVWVLKRKGRNLIWLLIFLVPLVGWIIFLCLENRSQPPALPVSSRPSSSIQPGLAPQGLGSQYRKYEP
jgi:hypothetical protein